MNAMTTHIAKLLKVSLEDAKAIQNQIDNDWLIDWSEASYRKINKVAREVAAELKIGK